MDSSDAEFPSAKAGARLRTREDILRLADACVKCGLCLPHCPTYRISGLEGESPRGRIALVQGLASEQLPPGGQTARHLENCTGCLNCQSVCPAGVQCGEIFDAGHAELRRQGRPGSAAARQLNVLSRRPVISRLLLSLLRFARHLGIPRLARLLGIGPDTMPGRILDRLPVRPVTRRRQQDATGVESEQGRVMLFRGCVSQVLDAQTLEDATQTLRRLGYHVDTPGEQTCCGALDLHGGDPVAASELAARNVVAFGSCDAPILAMASGCMATLDEYDRLIGGRAAQFGERLQDIGSFLNSHARRCGMELAPLRARVALFQPCTARNNPRRDNHDEDLLAQIPSLDLRILDTGFGCCGAAGHHFLTRPGQADALAAPVVEQIMELDPDYLAVANVGCALHLAGALAQAGHRCSVVHPVSVLRASLEGEERYNEDHATNAHTS